MEFTVYNKGYTYKSRASVDLKTLDELDSDAIIAQIQKYTLRHTQFRMGLMLEFNKHGRPIHTTIWSTTDDKKVIINTGSDIRSIYYKQIDAIQEAIAIYTNEGSGLTLTSVKGPLSSNLTTSIA